MTYDKIMDELKKEDEERRYKQAAMHLRQLLQCAICADCGEVIGDEDFDLNSKELLCHKICADKEESMFNE